MSPARRSLTPLVPRALGLVAALGLTLAAREAKAETALDERSWHRTVSLEREKRHVQRFAFELRFGGYYPRVDEELGGAATPFRDTFGSDPQFFFGLEVDWQALRIPYVGSLGPGVGWGYTTMSAAARDPVTGGPASSKTGLSIMPVYASAVLRLDELYRRTGVPIVPFVKGGGAGAYWSSGGALGMTNADGVVGEGLSFGYHFALGGALSLGFIERGSTARLREGFGVDHTYVFGEWMLTDLGSFAPNQMRVGSSSWVVGLALEL